MKKVIALLLIIVTVFALASCSKDGGTDKTPETKPQNPETDTPDTQNPSYADCVAVLSAIWDKISDENKFAAIGGSFDAIVNDAPGKFDITDADGMNNTLGLPNDYADKLDDAASLMHMMNANTFTGGAYHFKSEEDATAASNAIIDNIHTRQWMCGFPDTLVIISFPGNYIVSAFGADELIQSFKTAALEIDGVKLISETPAMG